MRNSVDEAYSLAQEYDKNPTNSLSGKIKFWQSIEKIRLLTVNRIFPGHHNIQISPDIIDKIADAFQSISDSHKLSHGNGIFDFGEFQIHI